MTTPKQNELYRPLLEIAAETTDSLSHEDFANQLTSRLSLSEEDWAEEISSGGSRLEKNIAFCVWNMSKRGALQKPSRGCFQITTAGRQLLDYHRGMITSKMIKELALQQIPNHVGNTEHAEGQPADRKARASIAGGHQRSSAINYPPSKDTNPENKIKAGYRELQAQLTRNLLDSISRISPEGFERLVVDLLEKMGYGKGETVGRIGDGGIDGIINQDALGLEKVYIQAKRWKGQVGEPEIRNFSGSLDFQGASKGVFVTTSRFATKARDAARQSKLTIRLIDGPELAKLMMDFEVGVVTQYAYKIQELDQNYFIDADPSFLDRDSYYIDMYSDSMRLR